MESETPCQRCGGTAFEELVCTTCGAVIDEICFGSEFNVFGSDKSPKFVAWKTKKNSPGLDYGLKVLQRLCKEYEVSNLIVETELLLKQIYSTKSFARKEDVGILAGCCLIYVKQKHNQYTSISDLSAKLGCPMKKVYKFSKMVKSVCSDPKSSSETNSNSPEVKISELADPKSTSEMLESTVIKIFSSVVDNKDEFIRKTTALTKLAYDCWLMSGRSHEGVIVAAGYLCWKSINPQSKSLTLKQFCSDFSLPYSKSSSKVLEMKNMLLKLGKKIPSGSKNYVNEKNILFHLRYILENSETLRNDLLTDTFKAEEIAKKEFSLYRKGSAIAKETVVLNNERRCDFQPIMDAPDVEISDSEIAKYIRSEKEVKLIKKIKEKYES